MFKSPTRFVAGLLALFLSFSLLVDQSRAAIQFSTTVRNGELDSIETTIGTSPTLKVRSGAAPANCAAADAGAVLATITLPSDWLNPAGSASKTLNGTWQDTSADAGGTAAHFRIYAGGSTCAIQGTITAGGGGGDMTLSSTTITMGDTVTIATFTLNAGNP